MNTHLDWPWFLTRDGNHLDRRLSSFSEKRLREDQVHLLFGSEDSVEYLIKYHIYAHSIRRNYALFPFFQKQHDGRGI